MNHTPLVKRPNRDGLGYVIISLFTDVIAILCAVLGIVLLANAHISTGPTWYWAGRGIAKFFIVASMLVLCLVGFLSGLSGRSLGRRARELAVISVPAVQRAARFGQSVGDVLAIALPLIFLSTFFVVR